MATEPFLAWPGKSGVTELMNVELSDIHRTLIDHSNCQTFERNADEISLEFLPEWRDDVIGSASPSVQAKTEGT